MSSSPTGINRDDNVAARRYGRERFEATHDPQDFLRWLNAYVNETGREDHELHALCSHAHSVIAALQNEIAALLPHAQGAAMPGSEHPAARRRLVSAEHPAAKPPVIGWGWRWQSDWVPWFERGPEPFVWRLNIGPLHIVRITERAARGDLSGS